MGTHDDGPVGHICPLKVQLPCAAAHALPPNDPASCCAADEDDDALHPGNARATSSAAIRMREG